MENDIEIKEPMPEKPIELAIGASDKARLEINMRYLFEGMYELCKLQIYSFKCRHLYWETKKEHEWHFIIEHSYQQAFSIYEEDPEEVFKRVRAMSVGLTLLVAFKGTSVCNGIESQGATNLLKLGGSSEDKWCYASNIKRRQENGGK
jgi:hypothetical protein